LPLFVRPAGDSAHGIVLWGVVAFITALIFDRWWQVSYGLAAGIWHPPADFEGGGFFRGDHWRLAAGGPAKTWDSRWERGLCWR